jgi:hypothetical protein
MEPNQQEQRQAANEDFLKALNELEGILQENLDIEEEIVSEVEIKPHETPTLEPELKIDLAAWEDAVADIEQYFESREKSDT